MQKLLQDFFLAVVTAAVPVLTAYLVVFIRKAGDSAAANAESIKLKTCITEATEAIAAAVAATNQTYVDSLKTPGSLTQRRRGRPRKRLWRPVWRPSVRRRRASLRPRTATSGNT